MRGYHFDQFREVAILQCTAAAARAILSGCPDAKVQALLDSGAVAGDDSVGDIPDSHACETEQVMSDVDHPVVVVARCCCCWLVTLLVLVLNNYNFYHDVNHGGLMRDVRL